MIAIDPVTIENTAIALSSDEAARLASFITGRAHIERYPVTTTPAKARLSLVDGASQLAKELIVERWRGGPRGLKRLHRGVGAGRRSRDENSSDHGDKGARQITSFHR